MLASVAGRFEQWTEARADLERVLAIAPKNAMAHYRMATVLFQLNERKQGYAEFETAYKLNKKLPTPPLAVAIYCSRTNQPKLVDQWLSYAEQNYGDDLPTRLTLARWSWQRESAADTKRHAAAALEKNPQSAEALFWLGMVAHDEQDLKTAEEQFEAARSLCPTMRRSAFTWPWP